MLSSFPTHPPLFLPTILSTGIYYKFIFISLQIHFHGKNWAELHKFIKPEQLHKDYGGLKTEYHFENMKQYLYKNDDKIKGMLFSFTHSTQYLNIT